MEASQYKENAFLTLTYAPENLPLAHGQIPTLRKSDAQKFLKRLRKRLEPHRIRYFLVGEYGDQSGRPHYHAAIFGLAGSPSVAMGVRSRSSLSVVERMVLEAWGLGFTQTGILARESMEYIAGYVVKKMTSIEDHRLKGRDPEFSLKSGSLGCGMIDEIAHELLGQDLSAMADVPSAIRMNGKLWPIGQSLKRRLRGRIGRDKNSPLGSSPDFQAAREFAFKNNMSLAEVLRQLVQGDADALVGKSNLRLKKGKL